MRTNETRQSIAAAIGGIDGEKSVRKGQYRQYRREVANKWSGDVFAACAYEALGEHENFVRAYVTGKRGKTYVRVIAKHDKVCRCDDCMGARAAADYGVFGLRM